MLVLVTGGTGVVGPAAMKALLDRGHNVRLFSRNAHRDAKAWGAGVEAFDGDVADGGSLAGAADGCDAVLHVVGIVDETPPHVTFQKVNVNGTANVVVEAERAGVPKLVFVSSLGCERGDSGYHRSKRRAEDIVRSFRGNWVIVRPGNVYGPGDEQVSLVLKMVRGMPAVPVLSGGDHEFQPVWHEDLGQALALVVERDDLAGRVLEIAGPERTTENDLLDRLQRLTGREPARIPLPGLVAQLGMRVADMLGIDTPLNESQLRMLEEGSVLRDPSRNALDTVLGITPTPLDEGLHRLADEIPEMLPSEGIGALTRKRFWVDIEASERSADELFAHFRRRFGEIVPIEVSAEPGTACEIVEGATLTMRLPVRGHIQVRVEEVEPHRITLVTLQGHPLAGAIRFLGEPRGDAVRFEVQAYDKPASFGDFLMMKTLGERLQDATWKDVVQRMLEESGGQAPAGIRRESETLDQAQSDQIEKWLEDLIAKRKRETESLV
jgi:NADH dehydrogenase